MLLQVSNHEGFENLLTRFEGQKYFMFNLPLFWSFVLAIAVSCNIMVCLVARYAIIKRILLIGFKDRQVIFVNCI